MVHAGFGRIIQGSFQGGLPAFRHSHEPRLPAVQRSAAQPASVGPAFRLPPNIDVSVRQPGQPLPPVVQRAMEAFFKTSLADVRVHVGPQASAIGAVAFTMGSDLFFAPGRFDVATPHGRQLLGHELTHVVQQRSGRVRNPFGAAVAVVQDPRLEVEAEHLGAMAARELGTALQRPASSAMPGSLVQRSVSPGGLAGPALRPPVRRPVQRRAVLQPMRLANVNPTWQETTEFVKDHPSKYGTIKKRNFGTGQENAFCCPGCDRWLPLVTATVDHIVPKSILKDQVELGGPAMIEVFTDKNKDTYGLDQPLDFETIRYQTGTRWAKKTFSDESKLEAFVAKHYGNDLDNLRLMCHSCNSSKGDRDNPQGSGAPLNPVGVATNDIIQVDDGVKIHNISVKLAPGVSKVDCYPQVSFGAAWTATRAYFLAKKYHSPPKSVDFGNGAEPAYDCPTCRRALPIAIATVDHIQDKSGHWWLSLDLDNLQLMCNICNSSKGNRG